MRRIFHEAPRARQPGGAISKPEKSKPGATVQPTSVQAPRLCACCHACAGTTACGRSPEAGSAPRRASRRCRLDHAEQQRRAGVPVPNLRRIDLVPARHLAGLGAGSRWRWRPLARAGAGWRGIAEGLAVVPAFRMRLQPEQADHVVGVHVGALKVL